LIETDQALDERQRKILRGNRFRRLTDSRVDRVDRVYVGFVPTTVF
jgi:hypothetical protein